MRKKKDKSELLEKFGLKKKEYGYSFVQAEPLPEEPLYWDKFLHSFVDLEDFKAFAKMHTPANVHEDAEAMNRALHNAEFLIGTLGLELKNFMPLFIACPEILTRPVGDIKGVARIFIECFYFELRDITTIINEMPEILQFSNDELLNRIVDLCHVMQVTRYTIFDLIHKYPKILFWTEEKLQNFLTIVAKIFKCHQNDLRNAIFNYPRIIEIPTDQIRETYDKVYAKGFTRLELRRLFIRNGYNFFESAESIIEKVDNLVKNENMTEKEAVTMLGDCPFVVPLKNPADHFALEKHYRMSRKFLNEWQYNFNFPHDTFLLKYLFARCTAIEMQFAKFANTDTHKIFSRYAYLREKLGTEVNFSKDLYSPDYEFESKHGVTMKEILEKYPLTSKDVERLFDDYNKLDGYILYWFPLEKPAEYIVPPLYYDELVIYRVFLYHTKLPEKQIALYTFRALGFTNTEIEFLEKTVPNIDKLKIQHINNIYNVFKYFDFTLEETNWLILNNPALLEYDPRALKNRLKIINCHMHFRFFCYNFPERI